MLKERASGMYRLSAFYFARTASDLPMEFTLPSTYIFMCGSTPQTPDGGCCSTIVKTNLFIVSVKSSVLVFVCITSKFKERKEKKKKRGKNRERGEKD